jgi:hypothetical protein
MQPQLAIKPKRASERIALEHFAEWKDFDRRRKPVRTDRTRA